MTLRDSSTRYPAGKLPAEDLARLLSRFASRDPRVIVPPGIGKDAAVIDWGDRYLIAKTDPITFATDEIGWYAVHINANDIAAMGGTPRWFLAALLLPEGKTGPTEVEDLFRQISETCEKIGISLCGGHTEITLGIDRPIVIGQMLGEVEKERLIRPERVRPGDAIILTKGIAIEGTSLIVREWRPLPSSLSKAQAARCRLLLKNPGISVLPEAKIALEAGEVHAMHDPTEGGLATGLHELATAASVGLWVDQEKIPILPETEGLCRALDLDPLGLIASGALLIVAAPRDSAAILGALKAAKIPAACIGEVWEREKGIKIKARGEILDLPVFRRDEIARLWEKRTHESNHKKVQE
jgi:hydrogenase expression/formation protein HypE